MTVLTPEPHHHQLTFNMPRTFQLQPGVDEHEQGHSHQATLSDGSPPRCTSEIVRDLPVLGLCLRLDDIVTGEQRRVAQQQQQQQHGCTSRAPLCNGRSRICLYAVRT